VAGTIEEATLRVKVDPTAAVTGAKQTSDAMDRIEASAAKAANAIKASERAAASLRDTSGRFVRQTTAGAAETVAAMDAINMSSGRLVGGLAALGIGFSVFNVIRDIVREVASLETALVNISRVTGFTSDEMNRIEESIDAASLSFGLSQERMLSNAKAAAELGIVGAEGIARFATEIEKLEKVTGFAGSASASTIASIMAVTKTGQDQIGPFASVLATLQTTTRASAADAAELGLKIASKGAQFRLTAADSAALGAAMASMGTEGKFAVSGIVESMDMMRDAIAQGDAPLRNLASLMGVSADEAKRMFEANSTDAFVKLMEGIKQANDAGVPFEKILGSLTKNADKLLQVIPPVAGSIDLMKASLAAARQEMGQGDTLNKRVAESSQTLGDRFMILRTHIGEVFEEGRRFNDLLKGMVDFGSGVIRSMLGIDSATDKTTASMHLAADAIKGVAAGVTAFLAIDAAVKMNALAVATGGVTKAFVGLGAVIAANPIGAIAVAVGAAVLAYQQFKDTTFQVGEQTYAVSDIVLGVWDSIVDRFNFWFRTIRDLSVWAFNGVINVARSTFDFLTNGVVGKTLRWIKDTTYSIVTGIFGFVKTYVNKMIGLYMSVIDVVGVAVTAIIDGITAFKNFDPWDVMDSGGVIEKLKAAFDPAKLFEKSKNAVKNNLAKDWVSDAAAVGKDVGQKVAEGISMGLDSAPELKEWLKDFNNLYGTDSAAGIAANITARRVAREALLAAGAPPTGNQQPKAPGTPGAPGGTYTAPTLVGLTPSEADDSIKKLKEMSDALRVERDLIVTYKDDVEALGDARERATAAVKVQELAEKAYKDNVVAQKAEIDGYLELLEQVQKTRRAIAAEAATDKMLDDLRQERSLLGLTSDERERATATTEFYKQSLIAFGGDTENATRATEDFRKQLQEFQKDRELVNLANDIGNAFADSFTEAVFAAESLNDVLKDLAKNVASMAFRQLVAAPVGNALSSGLSGLFTKSAKGNVFGPQGIHAFADGGIVSRPTMFGFNGGIGVMGEAGDEAIMPLTRNNGRLVGDGRGMGSVTIVQNITTPNADSFRKSQMQIAGEMKRGLKHGVS
jgi:TP901 family phage tail tape measure protein